MKLRPTEDRIIVQRIEAEEMTVGGIVLPDTAKQKPQRGKDLAVGPGRLLASGQRFPLQVAVGDEVLFGSYAVNEIKLDDQEFLIMKEGDILACIGLNITFLHV